MSIQPKNRKDSRRFTKLMSLVLSASLVFGNVAIAYANPNEEIGQDGPNVVLDQGDDQRTQAAKGVSTSANISDCSVSLSYGQVSPLVLEVEEAKS